MHKKVRKLNTCTGKTLRNTIKSETIGNRYLGQKSEMQSKGKQLISNT